MTSEQPSNGQGEGPVPPNQFLLACQSIAKGGVEACKQLGRELKVCVTPSVARFGHVGMLACRAT
jgi:hypothetical protein